MQRESVGTLDKPIGNQQKADLWQERFNKLDHNPNAQSPGFQNFQSNLMKKQFQAEQLDGLGQGAQQRIKTRDNMVITCFTGDRTVAWAQASLVLAGYDLGNYGNNGVDGIHGKMTTKAITDFQKSVGLKPTGKLDQETMRVLDKVTELGLKKQDIEMMGENKSIISDNKKIENNTEIYTHAEGTNIKAIYSNGSIQEIRTGGTWSWRNNNPGNIQYGTFAKQYGCIGQAGRFAVFPDYQTGFKAIIGLLKTKSYQSLTVYDAIKRYAPPSENNTTSYQLFISKNTGLPLNTPMNSLNDAQLNAVAKAITVYEGYCVGKIEILKGK